MDVPECRLGIDFGTSTTVAALAWPDGRIQPLLFDATPLLPSGVFVGPGSDVVFTGADAQRGALTNPGGFEPNPKRRIDDGTVWLGDRELTVVDLITAVLGRVAMEATRVAGRVPAAVVLTHPANWGRARIGVLAEAAARAGLAGVEFVPEPVAAAAYYVAALGRTIAPGNCLVVYDLGAGTFDVSVVRVTTTGFEVVRSAGLDDVGGLELDAAVVGHARTLTATDADAWRRLDWPQSTDDEFARHRLWTSARLAKEQLSRHPTTDIRLPVVGVDVHLTREEFEKAARPYLERTANLTQQTLRDAGVPREAIGGVFLVGGSSRIPLASTLLHQTLRIAPVAIDQPELVVATGSLHGRHPLPAAYPTQPPPPTKSPSPTRLLARRGVILGAAGVAALGTTSAVGAAVGLNRWRKEPTSNPSPSRSAGAPPITGARFLAELSGHTESIMALEFDPHGGDLFATGASDQTIRVWSVSTRGPIGGAIRYNPAGYGMYVRGVRFSPDGAILAACGNDYNVRLWNLRSRKLIGQPFRGHESVTYQVVFTPDGKTLMSSGADGTIRIWDVATHKQLGEPLVGHIENVYGMAINLKDPNMLASCGADKTVRFWDVAGREQVGASLTAHTDITHGVAFSPDGTMLASGSGLDGTARLWDVRSHQPIGEPLTAPGGFSGLAFSPDGTVLATAGRFLRLWDVATREPIGEPIGDGDSGFVEVRFSPDGKVMATPKGNAVFLWDVLRG